MRRVPLVVDASVAAKWIKPEVHSAHATQILRGPYTLLAPDLLWPEVGNILWKSVQRRELTTLEAHEGLRMLLRCPITVVPGRSLVAAALEMALQYRQTVYDALYVTLATTRECQLVTADSPLYAELKDTPLQERILWIEDVPSQH
ncbi:MAG TPA: type II toxin-antitoxin system VapC family toxin [Candidatus Methylomirabilis sp.]|nr:type II toxin-antitoxin system VapC family toxin [Candidatus Methylomirabilis sp.]